MSYEIDLTTPITRKALDLVRVEPIPFSIDHVAKTATFYLSLIDEARQVGVQSKEFTVPLTDAQLDTLTNLLLGKAQAQMPALAGTIVKR